MDHFGQISFVLPFASFVHPHFCPMSLQYSHETILNLYNEVDDGKKTHCDPCGRN